MHHFPVRTPNKTRSRLKWKNSQRMTNTGLGRLMGLIGLMTLMGLMTD